MIRALLSFLTIITVTVAGALPASAAAADSKLKGNLIVTGTTTHQGAATFNVPIAGANLNAAARDVDIPFQLAGGAVLADDATYEICVPMRRAGIVTGASLAAGIRIAGGTNTLAVAKRQGGTEVTMLSTATVDPAAVPTATFTAEALTLTATPANLAFVAGDVLIYRLVCGTMTTDGRGYTGGLRVRYTDE